MEELITQVTEKNAVIRDWSLKTQKAKGDSLTEGCISNLPEQVTSNARQNNLENLIQIWKQWDSNTRGIFTEKYGDIAHLIAVNEDMTPTIEEYAALLRIDNVQFSKIYVKEPKPMTFKKKLVRLTGMTDMWAEKQIKKKNEKTYLQAHDLWNVVQNDTEPPPLRANPTIAQIRQHNEDCAKKYKAMSCLHSGVSDAIFTRIMACDTPKEVWDKLKKDFQGSNKTRQQQLINLRRDFENLRMKDSETVKQYADRIMATVNNIRLLGDEFSDKRVVENVITTLPEKYEEKISSLEDSRDLSTIFLTELINALYA
ncbi:hypothetical protein CXB51_011152 [Gossypium anomalum]|uniref:Uncharacterized protein n=1 Tax=Gossypium anomalum TaxID=47600 RepID=A0A8J6D7C7_9ROSI|nr:hypothetical protein CXB51_011152 [Gossypium anomalum]